MLDVVMTSGGITSFHTAHLVKERTGKCPVLLFADTLIEDEDLYRFLIQTAGWLSGVDVFDLQPLWQSIPPVEEQEARTAHLGLLREACRERLPLLHWVCDGRTPWDVFKATRFLGNSRAAKCSHVLKQDAARKHLEAHWKPSEVTLHVGIHWSEMERYVGNSQRLGTKEAWLPWDCRSPLCEQPFLPADEGFRLLETIGISPPRLYAEGFSHNNCGGFCVKAGHGQFLRLLEKQPLRYAHHEREEEKIRQYLGKDVSIMRDRKGGSVKPLTMRLFRELNGAGCDSTDVGGCGCFTEYERNP